MKLTKNRLRQIIKEEIEEGMRDAEITDYKLTPEEALDKLADKANEMLRIAKKAGWTDDPTPFE